MNSLVCCDSLHEQFAGGRRTLCLARWLGDSRSASTGVSIDDIVTHDPDTFIQ